MTKASADKASADTASADRASAGKALFLPTLFLTTLFLPTLFPPTLFAEEPAGVQITAPADRSAVSGTATIAIQAPNPQAIRRVSVTRDGGFLDASTEPPFQIAWDTTLEADGPHLLVATVQDARGQAVTSPAVTVIVDNTPPTVLLTAPLSNSTAATATKVVAETSDNIEVAEVRFLVNGELGGTARQPPYVWTWDPSKLPNVICTLQAIAVDRAGNRILSNTTQVKVANPNRPPELRPIGNKAVKEGQTLAFTIVAIDPDGTRDPLTYRTTNLPAWASFNPETGQFQGRPDGAVASQTKPQQDVKVRFEACDPDPLCDHEEITITVLNVNQPPRLAAITDQELQEGQSLTLTIPPATDVDRDPLTYTVERLPAWLTFDAASRTFSGTPGFDLCSLDEPLLVARDLRVKACDPEPLCDQKKFSITVLNVNRPPALEAPRQVRVEEGKLARFTAQASDPDGDTLTLTIQPDPLPEGATFTILRDGSAELSEPSLIGTFQWTPREYDAGSYQFQITAAESAGSLSAKQAVVIAVREVNLTISGHVVTEAGAPFAGAIVELSETGGAIQHATTDARGFYVLQHVKPGSYLIRPRYEIKPVFTTTPAPQQSYHFSPLSQSVTLGETDLQDVDFTAIPLE